MKFARDIKIEERLTLAGIDWTYVPAVPYDSFEVDRSLKENARLQGRLNDDIVLDMGQSAEMGLTFSPLICYRKKNGKYFILCGNHRTAANGACDRSPMDVYVVNSEDQAILQLIAETDNLYNGQSSPRAHRIAQAVAYLSRFPGASASMVAKQYHVSEYTLSRHRNSEAVRNSLLNAGVRVASQFTQETLIALRKLEFNEMVMAEAGRVASRCSQPEVSELVAAAKEGKSEAEQLVIVRGFKPYSDDEKKPASSLCKADKQCRAYQSTIAALNKFARQHPTLAHCAITSPAEVKKAVASWVDVRAKFDSMHGV